MEIDLSKYKDYYREPDKKTVTEEEAAKALSVAWEELFGEPAKPEQIAILWAQTCLETGRFSKGFMNYNFGNIKHKYDIVKKEFKEQKLFTMFATGENIEHPGGLRYEWFEPPHYQTAFRAYETISDGAKGYIEFLSKKTRYKKAWVEVINGDIIKYSHELKVGGYYTANEQRYTISLEKLFREFLSKKDQLIPRPLLVTIPEIVINGQEFTPEPLSTRPTEETMKSYLEDQKHDIHQYKVVEVQDPLTKNVNSAGLVVMIAAIIALITHFLGLGL